MRARIDVSEIEAQTKIRAKYLRALENEEWSLLPGPTFVKSFLRTYAQALGLDGKALVEEYRLHHERPSEAMLEPIVAPSQRNRSRSRAAGSGGGPSRGYAVAVGTVVAVIVVLIVLLAVNGGGGSSKPPAAASTRHTTKSKKATGHPSSRGAKRPSDIVALSLTPTAAVYVCLTGEDGHMLIPGDELQAGQSTATFHARHFDLTLGNNAVTLYIDGRPRPVPASAQAIGYSITKARGRQPLPPSQQPACR
jgi:cytoskeleton protein RodZ